MIRNHKAVIPPLLLIVLLVVLAVLDIEATFESPLLLLILNTLFISGVAGVVAYLAARRYYQTGLNNLLLLGCGALAYGAASLIAAGLIGLPGGQNLTLTIHNTGALFGSICHLAATGVGLEGRVPGSRAAKITLVAYLGVLFATIWLTFAVWQDLTPLFFAPGVGPTLLRQVVLVGAGVLYAISAVLLLRRYARSMSEFLYWYGLGVGLIALGLLGLLLTPVVGSPVSWVARAAQYLGGLYFLKGLLTMRQGNGTRLEEAIANFFREAETNYKMLVEMATDAIIALGHDGRVLLWNSAAERLFGYSQAEAMGVLLTELIVPAAEAETWRQELQSLTGHGEASQLLGRVVEREVKRKDGQLFPAELSLSIRPAAGGWIGIVIIRDITDRVRMEEQLRVSLREKEVLLKEVHHRVKNNLQAIFNLLYLQAGYIQDPQVLQIFQDTQARVKSIALVHEKLYQTKDLAQLNFVEYLDSLAKHLVHAYGVNPRLITVAIDSDVISLDLDTAVSLGIIINELVSNSLKYAFSEGRPGEICIDLRSGSDGQLILTISDNGVGFPNNLDLYNPDTLGLQLVNMLTSHMHGQLRFVRNGGATVRIQFAPLWK